MTLLLILVLVTLVLFAMFLGGTLIAQGYLYQQPVDRLPLRALAAALIVGLFITLWVWIDKNSPRRYDTFFEFAPYQTKDFIEFEAVRWVSLDGTKLEQDEAGNPVEVTVKFRRRGAKGPFIEDGTDAPFQLNTAMYMTAAIRLSPDPDAEPIRLDAQMKEDKRGRKTYAEPRRFIEANGSSYVQADQLGILYVPSTRTVIVALFINLLLFVVWMVAFWPILRFTVGHAFGLAVVMGLFTMLLVMPLLFKPHRAAKQPDATAQVLTEMGSRGFGV